MTAGDSPARDVDGIVALANAYADSRNFDRAERVLREGLTAFPGNADLLANVARIQVLTDDYFSAIATAEAALAVSPDHGFAMRIYAVALDGGGMLGRAMQTAWRAATTHPHDRLAHFVYAELLLKAGYPHEALFVIGEALRLNPGTPDSHVLRGQILARLGRLDESTASYEEALRIDPANASAVHNIAVNGLARSRISTAVQGFLGAARLDPELGDLVRSNIGVALTGALRSGTGMALSIALGALVAASSPHEIFPRSLTAIVTFILVVGMVRFGRIVPLRTWRSILRTHSILALRLLIVVAAVPVGALATSGRAAVVTSVAAAILLIASLLVAIIGRRTGG